jgi:hypothetical protein
LLTELLSKAATSALLQRTYPLKLQNLEADNHRNKPTKNCKPIPGPATETAPYKTADTTMVPAIESGYFIVGEIRKQGIVLL